MRNNLNNYIWFISLIVMDNSHYHQNVLLCISKKKKFFLSFSPFPIAMKDRTLFARCVLLSFIYLIFVCVLSVVLLCISLLLFFYVSLMNKQTPSFSLYCAYYKLSHFSFHIKNKQRFSFYFDVSFLSFGKAICICTYISWFSFAYVVLFMSTS